MELNNPSWISELLELNKEEQKAPPIDKTNERNTPD